MTARPSPRILVALLVAVAVIAIVAGMMVIGSPWEERARRRDARRIQDLTDIARAVDGYWTRESRVPASFDELGDSRVGYFTSVDPFTQQPYEYRRSDSVNYELCAVFERDGPSQAPLMNDGIWPHGVGRTCFARVARKRL